MAIVDAYASPTMLSDANQYARLPATPGSAPASTSSTSPPPTPIPRRTSVTRRAGTARRRSTSSPCTARRRAPTSATSPRPAAQTPIFSGGLADRQQRSRQHRQQLLGRARRHRRRSTAHSTPIFEIGAVEGIGFFFSSGDNGYEGPAETPRPATRSTTRRPARGSPRSAAPAWPSARQQLRVRDLVGHPARPAGRERQVVESTPPGEYPADYDGSSGGGVSTQYTQPFYQARVVPNSLENRAAEPPSSPTKVPGGTRTCPRWPTRAPGFWSARPRSSRTGRPTPSHSAGSAAPAWPARRSPASRPTPSRPPATRRVRRPGDLPPVRHPGLPRRDRPPVRARLPRGGPQQLHRPVHQDRPARYLPAYPRHRR